MKVSKAQAQENRMRIVETASVLFRERGYDGVGVAELMSAAGFTHGGFYKHFASKADLMLEAVACGFAQSQAKTEGKDIAQIVEQYLSREHRNGIGDGCVMAALSTDAARQPDSVKELFAVGIERQLAMLTQGGDGAGETRAAAIDTLAHLVGAVVLSRACPQGSALADEILQVCRTRILDAEGSQAKSAAQ
ncbi:TPA: TetR/AcrR family transcriptional regulator [Serratia odorifera]